MANSKSPPQGIGTPPQDYDQQYMLTLVRTLASWMTGQSLSGDFVVSSLQFAKFPSNGYGLRVGAGWISSADGILRVVRDTDLFAPTQQVKVSVGTVRVA